MKNKLVFITDSGFWSHKPEIIKELNARYFLKAFVHYENDSGNCKLTDLTDFKANHKADLNIVFKKHRSRSFKRIWSDLKNIILPVVKYNADIIYIESFGSPYFLLLAAAFFKRKKVIIAVHDAALHEISENKVPKSALLYQKLYIKLFKNFQLFSYNQEKIFNKNNPTKTTFVARLFLVGTDLEKPNNNLIKETSFLYFGRILHYKGVDVLIKAINLLAVKKYDFKVTIAGSCSNWSELYEPLIDEPEKINAKINFIPKEEVNELFSSSRFFIVPYRTVTQSGPLMRAYNYDMIPICSNIDGFKEYISDAKTGFLFENESHESLAQTMENAIKLNEEDKTKIIDNIKEFKKQEFDIMVLANKYCNMFNNVIQNAK